MKLDFINMNNSRNKIIVYKVTVYYDFVHDGYFMEGSNDIILESWDIIY